MAKDPVIRWTYGEPPTRYQIDPQAHTMLRASVRFARLLFPGSRLVLGYNHVKTFWTEISAIIRDFDLEAFDATERLSPNLRVSKRNGWWKYGPDRYAPDAYELMLDNDVVLWRVPPAIELWLELGGVVVQGDYQNGEKSQGLSGTPYANYGLYNEEVAGIDPRLKLCSGILGRAPGITFEQEFHRARLEPFRYCSEQGFTALQFLNYPGPRRLVEYASVPMLTTGRYKPDELLNTFDGCHFIEHTIGMRHYWRDQYADFFEDYAEFLDKEIRSGK